MNSLIEIQDSIFRNKTFYSFVCANQKKFLRLFFIVYKTFTHFHFILNKA